MALQTTNKHPEVPAADLFPGAAIDVDDNEKVDPKEVKARVKTQNNNPRDTDGPALK